MVRLVLWLMNHCRLFNAKSFLYIKVGNLNTPFSTATTERYRRGHNLFPWIAPLDP